MCNHAEYDLMVRIAWAYYMDRMTQEEVAKEFRITRIKVQRLLKNAEKKNVVTISIKNPHFNLLQIEKKLIERFNLLDAIVVPARDGNLLQDLCIACALYLERKWMYRINSLGIGTGKTLSYMGNAFASIFHQTDTKNTFIISLQGVLTPDATWSAMDNGQNVAQALQATFFGIWAPTIAHTAEEAHVFRRQPNIHQALEMANNADIKIVSIGSINEQGYCFRNNDITRTEMQGLLDQGICGEILMTFFNDKGEIVNTKWTECSISMRLPSSKESKIIGVAGGVDKIAAIKAALTGSLLDVMVTDYETCKALLSE